MTCFNFSVELPYPLLKPQKPPKMIILTREGSCRDASSGREDAQQNVTGDVIMGEVEKLGTGSLMLIKNCKAPPFLMESAKVNVFGEDSVAAAFTNG